MGRALLPQEVWTAKIADAFNRASGSYDAEADLQDQIADRTLALISYPQPRTILEVGCGSGLLSQKLFSDFPTAWICATDLAPNMVQHAKNRVQALSGAHPTRGTWCVMDGGQPAVGPLFDLVISSMAVHWFFDYGLGLKRLFGCLAPSGELIVSCLGQGSFGEWTSLCHDHHVPCGVRSLPTVDAIHRWLPMARITQQAHLKLYSSAHVFLNSLKKLGAHTGGENYSQLSWACLRNLLRHAPRPFPVTYEIFYLTVSSSSEAS